MPTGTHALWHVLNAAVLYALLATAIRHRADRRMSGSAACGGFLAGTADFLQKCAASGARSMRGAPGTEGVMTVSFRLGIAGLGTVGASVVRMVERRRAAFCAAGLDIRVAAVSSRDRDRDRGLDLSGVEWFDDPVALARSGTSTASSS